MNYLLDMFQRERSGQPLSPTELGFLNAWLLNIINIVAVAAETAITYLYQFLTTHDVVLATFPWGVFLGQVALVFLLSLFSGGIHALRQGHIQGLQLLDPQLALAQASVDTQLVAVLDGSKGALPDIGNAQTQQVPVVTPTALP